MQWNSPQKKKREEHEERRKKREERRKKKKERREKREESPFQGEIGCMPSKGDILKRWIGIGDSEFMSIGTLLLNDSLFPKLFHQFIIPTAV